MNSKQSIKSAAAVVLVLDDVAPTLHGLGLFECGYLVLHQGGLVSPELFDVGDGALREGVDASLQVVEVADATPAHMLPRGHARYHQHAVVQKQISRKHNKTDTGDLHQVQPHTHPVQNTTILHNTQLPMQSQPHH